VAEEAPFNMLWFQRFSQQRVILKVDHAGSKIITGLPVSMELSQFFF
jgi:hypothetical protein